MSKKKLKKKLFQGNHIRMYSIKLLIKSNFCNNILQLKCYILKTTTTNKQTKLTMRTGTESQIWTSFGGLSAVRGTGEGGEKDARIKKHNWQVQNRQGDVKNSVGNGEAKELICTTH